jgi:hypothetical protein
LPNRFPAPIREVYAFSVRDARHMLDNMACTEPSTWSRDSLETAREKARSFYAACATPARPDLPSVVVVGDSHALQLVSGLKTATRDRANILHFTAIGCRPLLASEERGEARPNSAHCQALNEEIARKIVALKPAAIVVGGYYAEYFDNLRLLERFFKDFDANVLALRREGVTAPVFVMGQVPTWKPDMMDLVIAELRAGQKPTDVTREKLQPNSLEADALLAAHGWGENVLYVSQVAKLCDEKGCRRFVGPRFPDDMIALDYGHYTGAGSLNAAQNILGPVLAPVIDAARARKAN